jgi:glycosyltransferase involved in cell wall biosynthesis
MKIIIENIVFSIQRIGGISVVWFEFVKRIAKDKELLAEFIEYQNANQNILRESITIDSDKLIIQYSWFFNVRKFFNPKFRFKVPYIFHSSTYRVSLDKTAINVVTVHDFLYFKNDWKGFYIWFVRKIHRIQISNAIKKADCLICISQATKCDLIRYFPYIKAERIKVVYNGVSEDYFPTNESCGFIPYNTNEYCLFVGSRSRYKNFNIVVEALFRLNKNLVIIGKPLSKNELEFVLKYLPPEKFTVLSNISNEKLNILYNNAFCLLYLSSFEGFGIPIIEAQKAGCPVIAQEVSSIPEVIGKTPLLIKNLSVASILNTMSILENNILRDQIIDLGLKNATKFSWDKNYEEIKNLYKELIKQY